MLITKLIMNTVTEMAITKAPTIEPRTPESDVATWVGSSVALRPEGARVD